MSETIAADAHQPRKAYEYIRFSTPEQRKGHSMERQVSKAAAYAERHGLDLDRDLTFHDVGVSAYRGLNAEAGRLAHFVEAVASGQVPRGSVLLVEHLDRISRLVPRKALRVLEDIVEAGVSVVTLNDEREYTAASLDRDMLDLFSAIITFTTANKESENKASRLREVNAAKRKAMREGKPATAKLPAWLSLSEDRTTILKVPERVEVVQRMFQMSLAGIGHQSIAAAFNREGIEPWGEGKRKGKFWHRSYVCKVLENEAVIGRFTPHLVEFDGHRKTRKALEPIEGYFPAIIPTETFREIQVSRQALSAPQRGRHAKSPITNILAGLAACPKCGATMTRVVKGKRSRPAYVCTRAKSKAGCEYRSVRCELVEAAVLQRLPARLKDLDGATGDAENLVNAVDAAEGQLAGLEKRIEFYLDELFHEPSGDLRQTLREKLRQLQEQQVEARKVIQSLQEQREIASGLTVKARVQRVLEALEPPEGEPVPADVNRALRLIFKRAVLQWATGAIDLEWHHGGTCTLHFSTFTNQPGPGWRWENEEDDDDNHDHQVA